MQSYEDYVAERNKKAEEKIATLKPKIFDALAKTNIAYARVEFDGSDDSGCIEEVTAYAEGTDGRIELDGVLLSDIEDVSYAILSRHYGGWENNDGAYGELVFHVPSRIIEFEINIRFTDVNTETMEI